MIYERNGIPLNSVRVTVITAKAYYERPGRDETEFWFISPDKLKAVLDSAATETEDRNYVLFNEA